MPAIIRELQKNDLPQVTDIFGEFVKYHEHWDHIFEKIATADEMWGKHIYDSHTQNEHCKVLVAELDSHIVGYCVGRIVEKPPIYQAKLIGEVDNIAVKEGYKRMGIGERLFTTMKAWFSTHGVAHIETEVATTNPQSTNFWKKMGGREFITRMEIRIS